MPYSTIAMVQTAIGGLVKLAEFSDLENGEGVNEDGVNEDVVNDAIALADGIINSYVGHRYSVELLSVSDTISRRSAYWAARTLRMNRYQGQPMELFVIQEQADVKWLEGIARGVISLGIEPEPTKASIVIDKAGARDTSLSVSRCRLKDFI